jgi:glycosyltransferase involved in cell wall biosynthesis
LYDNFGSIISKQEARAHLNLPAGDRIILFFGFIRKYKGLDLLLEAMHILQSPGQQPQLSNLKLLIAGEFYEDERQFHELAERLGIKDRLILRTGFIPDNEVRYYLCAADAVIQPYRNATQSGVTPLAYHFERPMVVTNVGGLPALVPHEKAGLVVKPEAESIAAGITKFYQLGEDHFIPYLRQEKLKFSWHAMISSILDLAGNDSGL